MSLGRFLAAGRSLMGMSSEDGRYRMTSKTRLPKFNSDRNPFAAPPKAEAVKIELPKTSIATPAPAPASMAVEQVSLFETKAPEQKPVEMVRAVKPAPVEPQKIEVRPELAVAAAPVPVVTGEVSLFESKAPEQKPVEMVSEVRPAPAAPKKIEVKAEPAVAPASAPAAPKRTVMDLRNLVKNFNAVEYVATWTARWKKAPRPARMHVQTELLLEKVRPVRNDLSDTDLEVVTRKKVELPKGPQPYLKPLTKPEPTTWNRLTSRIFGHSEVR